MRGCAGWPAPFFCSQTSEDRFSRVEAHLINDIVDKPLHRNLDHRLNLSGLSTSINVVCANLDLFPKKNCARFETQ